MKNFLAITLATLLTTTLWAKTPELLNGKFTVNGAGKQVQFSCGNLQYNQVTDDWRFAESQTDKIGQNNEHCGESSFDGYIDLFGWSTTANYYGVSTSQLNEDYAGDFSDWGASMGEGWFTMSKEEWDYLLHSRPHAFDCQGIASINGVNGSVLLPDDFVLPDGLNFTPGCNSEDGEEYYAYANNYTVEQWEEMESAGAVFLPAAGLRFGSTIQFINAGANYWTSSSKSASYATDFFFYSNKMETDDGANRYAGASVRLVKAVEATPTAIDETETTSAPIKTMRNGQLIISRQGAEYNAQGAIIQ